MVTRLRMKLMEMRIPQTIITEKTGIAPSTLSLYCNGRKRIIPRHLVVISELLSCHPSEISGNMPDEDVAVG
jgi:DNA-binding Xre family transcriptional regulator